MPVVVKTPVAEQQGHDVRTLHTPEVLGSQLILCLGFMEPWDQLCLPKGTRGLSC